MVIRNNNRVNVFGLITVMNNMSPVRVSNHEVNEVFTNVTVFNV